MKIDNHPPPERPEGNALVGCAVILALIVLAAAGAIVALYLAIGFALGPLWFGLWIAS